MSQTWGRTDAAGTWPHPKPVWTIAALLVAHGERRRDRDVSVRRDLDAAPAGRISPSYVRSEVMSGLGFTTTRPLSPAPGRGPDGEPVGARRRGQTGDDRDRRDHRSALTETAVQVGDRRLVWQDALLPPRHAARLLGSLDLSRSDPHGSRDARRCGAASACSSRVCWSRFRRTSRARVNDGRGDGSRARNWSPRPGSTGAFAPTASGSSSRRASLGRTTLGARAARDRVESLPDHGRLGDREIRAHPAAACSSSRHAARPPSSTTRRSNTRRSSTRPRAAT